MNNINNIAIDTQTTLLCSDVHTEHKKLEFLLESIRCDVSLKIFLGDALEKDKNPEKTLEILNSFDLCISGNHDRESLARFGVNFSEKSLGVLSQFRHKFKRNNYLLVHSSPIGDKHIYELSQSQELFEKEESYDFIFAGHTHVPQLFSIDKKSKKIDSHIFSKKTPLQAVNLDSSRFRYFITVPSLVNPRWGYSTGYMVLNHISKTKKRLLLQYLD